MKKLCGVGSCVPDIRLKDIHTSTYIYFRFSSNISFLFLRSEDCLINLRHARLRSCSHACKNQNNRNIFSREGFPFIIHACLDTFTDSTSNEATSRQDFLLNLNLILLVDKLRINFILEKLKETDSKRIFRNSKENKVQVLVLK